MNSNKQFGDGLIYRITSYIYWFLTGSIYFFITNIIFLIVSFITINAVKLGYKMNFAMTSIWIFSAIPSGASITAIMSYMSKIIRYKNIEPTKDFFKAYKENFFQSIQLCALQLSLIYIAIIDINLFAISSIGRFITIGLLIIVAYIICSSFYIFMILSRYNISNKSLLKLSLYCFICKPLNTLLNIGLLVLSLILIELGFFIVTPTILFFGIMFYGEKILSGIKEEVEKNNNG